METEKIQKLYSEFTSDFWNIREQAIDKISAFDTKETADTLFSLIKDKYGIILYCRYIEKTQNIYSINHIDEFLNNPDSDIKTAAISVLKKMPVKITAGKLPILLKSGQNDIIAAAIEIIKNHRIGRMIPILLENSIDYNDKLVELTINCFEKIGDTRAADYCINLLNSKSTAIVIASINALTAINPEKYLKFFIPLLKSNKPDIRQHAVFAISKTNKKKAFSLLLKHYDFEMEMSVKIEILKRIARSSNIIIIESVR